LAALTSGLIGVLFTAFVPLKAYQPPAAATATAARMGNVGFM
jgi:hypothetical protein